MPKSLPPSFAELLDWLEGRLPVDEAQIVENYVRTADPATQADLAWLRAFRAVSDTTVLRAPPADLHTRLVRSFAAQAPDAQRPPLLRQLLATLLYDSHVQFAPAGVRAAATPTAQRQLVYTTGEADVALNIHPRSHERTIDVHGQVFAKTTTPLGMISVQVLENTDERGITRADDLGAFVFEALAPGVYDVVVSADTLELVIASVPLDL